MIERGKFTTGVACTAVLIAIFAAIAPRVNGADATTTPAISRATLPQQWHFAPPQVGAESPSLTDPVAERGGVYFGDTSGTVRAADPQSDKIIWERKLGGRLESLIIDTKQIYVAGSKGVDALQKGTGEPVWHTDIAGTGDCTVLAEKDMLFVGGNDGLLYALDRNTGDQKWTHSMMDENVVSSRQAGSGGPARPRGISTDGTNVYQSIFDQSRVIACDAGTGEQRWSFVAKGWIWGAAAFDEKHVFVGTQDNVLYCLAKETGEVIWKFETKNRIESTPLVSGRTVFFPSCDGFLYAVNAATGELIWKFESDRTSTGKASAIYSTPLICRDAVWFAAGEGHVYGLNPATGNVLFKFRPSEESELYSSLAANDSDLFVTTRQKNGQRRVGGAASGENAIFAFMLPSQ